MSGGEEMGTTDVAAIVEAAAALTSEHRRLGELVRRLEAAEDAEALAPLLADLHGALHEHFAHEEYPGGLYERVGACSAAFRHRVRVLVDDHYQILATVYGLSRSAVTARGDALAELKVAVGEVVAWLQRHEALEHELFELAKARG